MSGEAPDYSDTNRPAADSIIGRLPPEEQMTAALHLDLLDALAAATKYRKTTPEGRTFQRRISGMLKEHRGFLNNEEGE